MKTKTIILSCCIALICLQMNMAQSVVNTVHNLSVSGPGNVRSSSEQEICIFCHTPHNSKPNSPLWNRDDPGVIYDLYTSTTIQAVPGQPTGSSILCLSCHDGTIALGNVLSRTADINFLGGITQMPIGRSNLSTDLSDDHPVSFLYNSALASSDGQLIDPALISYPVRLENDNLQCTSCHDPHNDLFTDFLLVNPQYSELCLKCHDRNYWGVSSHSTSSASWNGSGTNPWFHTEFGTVAENGCENCHSPHSAEGKATSMNYIAEESNCLVCHNGNVASSNIETQLTKTYGHDVYSYNLSHDPAEDPLIMTMHVECQDCHNPHAVNNSPANAPDVSGSMAGVKGVTLGGSTINSSSYEYEICFRCHADSPGKPASHTTRQIEQNNTRLEFNPSNPSFHPVASEGQNTNVPSLIAPTYSESSQIYCTDCHSSDGSGSPAGPHGSSWPAILKARYETANYTSESSSAYALCYACHNRSSILNNESFGEHKKHIVDEGTPCNACHDPHGISNTQGNSTNNSNLINFDLSIVSPNGGGILIFVDTGDHHGYCMLRCHGDTHGPGMSY